MPRKRNKKKNQIKKYDFRAYKAEKIRNLKQKQKKNKKSKNSLPSSNKKLDVSLGSELNNFEKKHKKSYSVSNADKSHKEFSEFKSQTKYKNLKNSI